MIMSTLKAVFPEPNADVHALRLSSLLCRRALSFLASSLPNVETLDLTGSSYIGVFTTLGGPKFHKATELYLCNSYCGDEDEDDDNFEDVDEDNVMDGGSSCGGSLAESLDEMDDGDGDDQVMSSAIVVALINACPALQHFDASNTFLGLDDSVARALSSCGNLVHIALSRDLEGRNRGRSSIVMETLIDVATKCKRIVHLSVLNGSSLDSKLIADLMTAAPSTLFTVRLECADRYCNEMDVSELEAMAPTMVAMGAGESGAGASPNANKSGLTSLVVACSGVANLSFIAAIPCSELRHLAVAPAIIPQQTLVDILAQCHRVESLDVSSTSLLWANGDAAISCPMLSALRFKYISSGSNTTTAPNECPRVLEIHPRLSTFQSLTVLSIDCGDALISAQGWDAIGQIAAVETVWVSWHVLASQEKTRPLLTIWQLTDTRFKQLKNLFLKSTYEIVSEFAKCRPMVRVVMYSGDYGHFGGDGGEIDTNSDNPNTVDYHAQFVYSLTPADGMGIVVAPDAMCVDVLEVAPVDSVGSVAQSPTTASSLDATGGVGRGHGVLDALLDHRDDDSVELCDAEDERMNYAERDKLRNERQFRDIIDTALGDDERVKRRRTARNQRRLDALSKKGDRAEFERVQIWMAENESAADATVFADDAAATEVGLLMSLPDAPPTDAVAINCSQQMHTALTPAHADRIAAAISRTTRPISMVSLSGQSRIQRPGVLRIIRSLQSACTDAQLRCLSVLQLSRLGVNDEIATSLTSLLPRLPAVRCVDCSAHAMTDAGASKLLRILPSCPRMTALMLDGGMSDNAAFGAGAGSGGITSAVVDVVVEVIDAMVQQGSLSTEDQGDVLALARLLACGECYNANPVNVTKHLPKSYADAIEAEIRSHSTCTGYLWSGGGGAFR